MDLIWMALLVLVPASVLVLKSVQAKPQRVPVRARR